MQVTKIVMQQQNSFNHETGGGAGATQGVNSKQAKNNQQETNTWALQMQREWAYGLSLNQS